MQPEQVVLTEAKYRDHLDKDWPLEESKSLYRELGFLPRAFVRRDNTAIVVLRGHQYDNDLMCHEYGHWLDRNRRRAATNAGVDLKEARRRDQYGHPNRFVPRLIHTVRHWFDTTTPWGPLRARRAPPELWQTYREWNDALAGSANS